MTLVKKQRIASKRKLQWLAETRIDNPKAAFTHLKQVGHNLVQLLLYFTFDL